MIWCVKGIGWGEPRPRHGGAKTVQWTVFSGERARTPARPGLRRKRLDPRRVCAACRTARRGPVVRMQCNECALFGFVLAFFARNQGAHAPPGLPLVSPLVRETNGMARPPPVRERLQPWPAEPRLEGLRDKAPRTSLGAPSRGPARPCGAFVLNTCGFATSVTVVLYRLTDRGRR